jgi:hypothetical protein
MVSRSLSFFVLFVVFPVFAAEPTIRFVPPAVEVTGLDAAILAKLTQLPPADWTSIFSVRVATAESAMLGTYRIEKDALRFEPRFPLIAGLKYRATFDPSKLPGANGGKPLIVEMALPKPAAKPAAVVVQVYPTRNDLPENQLKFYLHFSRPMSRGESLKHVHLVDAAGKTVERPFLELEEELWDPAGTRFTLFFHPGRVKRGVQPREELGPPLEEGKRYTLLVDAAWPDEDGQPLKAEFRKSFSVGKPDDVQPDPKNWKLHVPAVDKTDALRVQLPKSLDHALLQRMLWVADAAGKRAVGTIHVSREETVWDFVPEKSWVAGAYRLMVDTALEDLAGNSVASPFEVMPDRPVAKVVGKTVELRFTVR